jgi:lambda family phage portal protein
MNALEKVISVFSPSWALSRMADRQAIEMLGNHYVSYDAAQINRDTSDWGMPPAKAGDVEYGTRQWLRQRAQNLYLNNEFCQSVVKGICGSIDTTRMIPTSLAVDADGNPDTEFIKRARDGFRIWMTECDARGKPGFGGQSWITILNEILTEVILSGDALTHMHVLGAAEAKSLDLKFPLTIQAMEAERLNDSINTFNTPPIDGLRWFEGIGIGENGRPVQYEIYSECPNHPMFWKITSDKYAAKDILHAFMPVRPSGRRGYSWLSPAMLALWQIGVLQNCELLAAKVNACFGVVQTTQSATSPPIGTMNVGQPTDKKNPTITLQPAMIPYMRAGNKLESFDTKRPNLNVSAFIQQILQGVSGAFPLKASQLHGDYRESSYSSEMSATNDNANQVALIHGWFCETVCAPLYRKWVEVARLNGWFIGYESSPEVDPKVRRLFEAKWPKPAFRSINPDTDAKAAQSRIHTGITSVSHECEAIGGDPLRVIDETAEWLKATKAKKLPQAYGVNVVGAVVNKGCQSATSDPEADDITPDAEPGAGPGDGKPEQDEKSDDKKS